MIELLHNTYGLLQELADFSESFYQHDKEIENQSKEAFDKTLKLTDYIEHCHQEIEALAEGKTWLSQSLDFTLIRLYFQLSRHQI